ncbi:hypothetical protein OC846_001831 [Tilletia horrida]|uniref:Uncharacterized protein n=1 Tax=Tilletia horrida TaxID=155126 RepID=A0AAN6JTH5_9BASI|nr:hypothetical protein OC845_001579 [Tilletia horrida]KAK0555150.1 hypothetical protein OC846_001831 [Tilletia horrida]KAK0568420.1 hypothetical protein OC861_001977 [Tilletia horrida]
MGFWDSALDVVGSIPVIGHITAGIEYAVGDSERGRKALAASTGNLCGTLGAVGGFCVGGPGGAVAGGAAGSALGGQVESAINGNGLDLDPTKIATDAVIGGATSMIGGGGASSVLKGITSTVGKDVAKSAAGSAAKTVMTSTAGQVIKQIGSQNNPPAPKPKTGGEDEQPPQETIRVVTRNQEAKANELNQHATELNKTCDDFKMPPDATYHVRSLLGNTGMALTVVKHPLPWVDANAAVEQLHQMLVTKKTSGGFAEDQAHMNETGHAYDKWPIVDAGLTKYEQLLQQLRTAMLEVEYMAAQKPRVSL